MTNTPSAPSSVIPGMWYRDAPAAVEWLCRVFGFEKRVVVPGPDGTILHAELTLGGGMVMLGSVREEGLRRFIAQPDEIGGVETHGLNLIVADADAVYARAKAVGAGIVQDIENKPYGGRGFTCLDLERRLWHVSTYDPWQSGPQA